MLNRSPAKACGGALLSGQHVARWATHVISNPGLSSAACSGWRREYRRLIQNRQRMSRFATGIMRSSHLLSIGMTAVSIWPPLGTAVDQVDQCVSLQLRVRKFRIAQQETECFGKANGLKFAVTLAIQDETTA